MTQNKIIIDVDDTARTLNILRQCFEDVIWLAIRYAHGRHTYAPGMVRRAVMSYKGIYPDFELRKDGTITPPPTELKGLALKEDYLDDLFEV